jgi:hypothetical protein
MNRRALLSHFAATLLGAVSSVNVWADAPPRPPARHEARSPDNRIAAISDPLTGTKIVEVATGKELWSMPGWHRWLVVSNDGKHLATGSYGLVPREIPPYLVLIRFWNQGKVLKAVSLQNLFPDKSVLKQTVSHYYWGSVEGLNDRNELLVATVDGRKLRFNMATGTAQ